MIIYQVFIPVLESYLSDFKEQIIVIWHCHIQKSNMSQN